MVAVYNSFETGTNGSTITTGGTGGGSDTALDFVTIGAGATATFDNSKPRGNLAAKLNAGSTPVDVGMEWSTAVGTLSTWYQRIYYYATSHPTNAHRIMDATTAGGAALCAGIIHQSAGTLCAADGGFNVAAQGALTVPLNQWVRVEMKVIGSPTTGQISFRLFTVPDAVNPTETQTSSATTNTSSSGVNYRFGLNGDAYDANRTIWIKDLGVSSVDWMGPATWANNRPTLGLTSQAIGRAVTW